MKEEEGEGRGRGRRGLKGREIDGKQWDLTYKRFNNCQSTSPPSPKHGHA